jgi:DNA-binding beta-propeller fold protein YncE
MAWTRRDFLASGLIVSSWAIAAAPPRRVRTIAGALRTPVANPYGIIPGRDGTLYFCEVDSGFIRRLDLRTGAIANVAGAGVKGYSGDGGPASRGGFSAPHEIRFDEAGNLYIVERDSHVVRRIDARTNVITTVAGTGIPGFAGDGGPAAKAQLNRPHSIAFDASGDLLICDIGNHRVRVVGMKTGTIRTFAGTGVAAPTPDDAAIAGTPLNGPRSIDADRRGNLYLVLREGNAVFRLEAGANRLTRIAGTGEPGFLGDNGPARRATLNGPKGIACADRSLYIVDTENHAIRHIDQRTGRIETVLGTGQKGNGADGDPLQCGLNRPHGVCFHRDVLYVTDSENNRILAVS